VPASREPCGDKGLFIEQFRDICGIGLPSDLSLRQIFPAVSPIALFISTISFIDA
jgi:hypothetical protein